MTTGKVIDRARERASRMGKASQRVQAERRMASPPPDYPEPWEPGEYLGSLTWHGADGTVRRWQIRQGPRGNQIAVDGVLKPHGWDWFFGRLRKHLACLTRYRSRG